MRPTIRAVVLFAAGIPLSLAIVLFDQDLWPVALAYLGFAVMLTGLDAVLAVPPRALAVHAKPPPILYIGDGDDLEVFVVLARGRPETRLRIVCDVNPFLAVPPAVSARIVPDARTRVPIRLIPLRRGTAVVERLWLHWLGPFGLVRCLRIETVEVSVPVTPNVRAVRAAALRFWAWDALFGIKTQNQQGDGTEFNALREYVPGYDHRAIDWKHSARHRKLVCKEFQTERNHQIVLAFDTGHLMSEPLDGIPKLDHAINSALLIAYMSLRGGDRIGVYGFDSTVRHYSAPVDGTPSFTRLQRASAELDYHFEETNFTLGLADLAGRLNRRSLIILQTEFVDTVTAELMVENLGRLAARHLVLFVTLRDPILHTISEAAPNSMLDMTRSVIADNFLHERLIVFQRLRRMGIHCLESPSHTIGIDLLNRYLDIKRQELI